MNHRIPIILALTSCLLSCGVFCGSDDYNYTNHIVFWKWESGSRSGYNFIAFYDNGVASWGGSRYAWEAVSDNAVKITAGNVIADFYVKKENGNLVGILHYRNDRQEFTKTR
jgi:hypothetical protein